MTKRDDFVGHFPCKDCGQDPYMILRMVQIQGRRGGEVEMCKPGFKLFKTMMTDMGFETTFQEIY